jgi:hypothetical protein
MRHQKVATPQAVDSMTEVKIYPAAAGGWMYVVLVAERPVVIGWCETRTEAEQRASLA